jgi:hypothetical protein
MINVENGEIYRLESDHQRELTTSRGVHGSYKVAWSWKTAIVLSSIFLAFI